jgi:predicted lipoprotein with Yx(FWY)xxD motif
MRTQRWIVVVALVGLGLAACGDDDDGGGSAAAESSTTTSTTEEASTTTSTASAGGTTLAVAETGLGTIVTDADGRTVYAFTQDTAGESTCTGGCAGTWPPLATDGDPAGGADVTGELGTTERDDGSLQVTLAGMPLYYFTPDGSTAGSTQGQGVGGVWFVVAPDGTLIQDG